MAHEVAEINIIESEEAFDQIYEALAEKAVIKSNPVIRLIGLDCEMINQHQYPKSFEKYLELHPRIIPHNQTIVCKLQIYTEGLCILIDLVKMAFIPDKLAELLKNESWLKTGVGISNDILLLSVNYNLGQCSSCLEMKNIASLCDIATPNLLDVYRTMTGDFSMNKDRVQLSDWSLEFTLEQIRYARNDAYMSYVIGKKMIGIMCPALKNTLVKIDESSCIMKCTDDPVFSGKKQPLCIKMPTTDITNYVGRLQEYSQKNNKAMPIYEETTTSVKGTFVCGCEFEGKKVTGFGKNKKDAKQDAAKKMFDILHI